MVPVFFGPFADAADAVAGIRRLHCELECNIDGEEPATVHAALGRHVDPATDAVGIDECADVIQPIDLRLWSAHVPEEIHHFLNEHTLRSRYASSPPPPPPPQ